MGPLESQQYLRFVDERLGELSATVENAVTSEWCSWEGSLLFPGHTETTWVSLGGDSAAPRQGLRDKLYQLLDALEKISEHADRKLRERVEARSISEFYLSSISVWDEADELFQLEFSPRKQAATKSFFELEFYWPENDEFTNHHIVIRPTPSQLTSGDFQSTKDLDQTTSD
jgi:hypothetical protein